jgi:hypothetical protein
MPAAHAGLAQAEPAGYFWHTPVMKAQVPLVPHDATP